MHAIKNFEQSFR